MQNKSTWALWNLGFRPFFLLAGIFAATSQLLWIAQVTGWSSSALFRSSLWHAHEMLFGYTAAVVAGFLFTAVRNWTNQPTPTGLPLAAIVALWLGARILVFTPWIPVAACLDLAFNLALAGGIALPLVRSGNYRNLFFVGVILALGLANLTFYLTQLGVIDHDSSPSLQTGLDLILFLITMLGGRVIPMFTGNAIAHAEPRRSLWLERMVIAGTVSLVVVDLLPLPGILVGIFTLALALVQGWRLALWQPWLTLQKPILWILHFSYGWIVVYLALRSLSALGWIPPGSATHALTAGAIGGLTLGMMTRVSRGHTGRALQTGALEVTAYVLVQLAALVRVLASLMAAPQWFGPLILISGLLWAGAFTLFAVVFYPMLTQPRVDGRPG
jgi:uncharacterized protein involved in response to NO